MEKIGVAAVGNVLDINCWSNIPYYFYTTGERAGLFHNPFNLDLQKLNLPRKIWNLTRVLTGQGIGGYQYSNAFLIQAESQIPYAYFQEKVISFNQTFPRASTVKHAGGEMYYYIDITLQDLFQDPSFHFNLSFEVMAAAIEQEKENYRLAKKVVTMGSWVRKSLIENYEVPEEKIETIMPGPNMALPPNFPQPIWRPGAGKQRDFVMGFVGKDWKRKGLPLLISIKNGLRGRGYKVKIMVIGNAPEGIEEDPDIEFAGFINKQTQMLRFISKLRECDMGCLFSTAEPLGISTLEFIKAGIPVAGFFHQGLLDTLLPGVSLRFDPEEKALSIVDRMVDYLENDSEQKRQYLALANYREEISWETCIESWSRILQ